MKQKQKYYLAGSLICADPLNIGRDVKKLVKGAIDYIHIDIMDGNFVPRYGLYPEQLKSVKTITKIPMDVHMMTEEPERYIELFAESGVSIMAVHFEACRHLHYTLKKIKEHKMKVGVVLNYATPLSVLDYILDDVDMVELMAINPGIVGHKLIPGVIEKIMDLKKKITESGKNIFIEIDGGVNLESAPQMIRAGADILVCGTSSIFHDRNSLDKNIKDFRIQIDKVLKDL